LRIAKSYFPLKAFSNPKPNPPRQFRIEKGGSVKQELQALKKTIKHIKIPTQLNQRLGIDYQQIKRVSHFG
jgi:hypothetical protein